MSRSTRFAGPKVAAAADRTSSSRTAPGTTTAPCTRWSLSTGISSVLSSISQNDVCGSAAECSGNRHGSRSKLAGAGAGLCSWRGCARPGARGRRPGCGRRLGCGRHGGFGGLGPEMAALPRIGGCRHAPAAPWIQLLPGHVLAVGVEGAERRERGGASAVVSAHRRQHGGLAAHVIGVFAHRAQQDRVRTDLEEQVVTRFE